MCIQQVQAWQHGSALFNSEVEAVEAALKEYAQKLMREHSSDPFTGLVGMTDKLVPLLQRYEALTAPDTAPNKPLRDLPVAIEARTVSPLAMSAGY